jgi:hypothetical protein
MPLSAGLKRGGVEGFALSIHPQRNALQTASKDHEVCGGAESPLVWMAAFRMLMYLKPAQKDSRQTAFQVLLYT